MNNRNVDPEQGSWGRAWHGFGEIPAMGEDNFPSKPGNCHRCHFFPGSRPALPQEQVKFELSPPFASVLKCCKTLKARKAALWQKC